MLTTVSSTSANLQPINPGLLETATHSESQASAIAPMELWAFLENSDFMRSDHRGLYRMDEVKLIRHDEFLNVDYQLLADIGCKGVRDAARWLFTNPSPGVFNWTWMDQIVEAADKFKLHLYLDLW